MTDPKPSPNPSSDDAEATLFPKPNVEDEGHNEDMGLSLSDDQWEDFVDGWDEAAAQRNKEGRKRNTFPPLPPKTGQ